ncbi:MAG: fasciclin domain-containing protein [Bacteroidota bacterium]
MKKILFITFLSLFVSAQSLIAQCGSHHRTARTVSYQHEKDIVDIAASADDFSTLVAAVKAADLVSTLKSDGPFTVFAPTNDAFGRLPAGTVESLLEPKAKGKLTTILTYHVIPTKISAEMLVMAIKATGGDFPMKTVAGETLTATIKNGKPALVDAQGNTAYITNTDLNASNGIIHVIDTVVLP